MADNVNQPSHYKVGGIEAIDYIAAKLGNDGFRAYCVGNVLKYASRWQAKNGIEDLRKASVYLCWAINGNPEIKLHDEPARVDVAPFRFYDEPREIPPGTGIALAQAQYDAAESPNPLNTADTVGPGEA